MAILYSIGALFMAATISDNWGLNTLNGIPLAHTHCIMGAGFGEDEPPFFIYIK
jgi:hypothetical protein